MLEGNAEIDPVKYGVLWQKVQDINKKKIGRAHV